MNKQSISLIVVLTAIAVVILYNIVDHESMALSKTTRNIIRWIVFAVILAGGYAMLYVVPS